MPNQVTRGPLGPNDASSADKPYEYVAWPAWRFHPETGQGQIFESADEVPEGWSDLPPGATPAGEEPIAIDPSLTGQGTDPLHKVTIGIGKAGACGIRSQGVDTDHRAVLQTPQGQFADYKRMGQHPTLIEQFAQALVALT